MWLFNLHPVGLSSPSNRCHKEWQWIISLHSIALENANISKINISIKKFNRTIDWPLSLSLSLSLSRCMHCQVTLWQWWALKQSLIQVKWRRYIVIVFELYKPRFQVRHIITRMNTDSIVFSFKSINWCNNIEKSELGSYWSYLTITILILFYYLPF